MGTTENGYMLSINVLEKGEKLPNCYQFEFVAFGNEEANKVREFFEDRGIEVVKLRRIKEEFVRRFLTTVKRRRLGYVHGSD